MGATKAGGAVWQVWQEWQECERTEAWDGGGAGLTHTEEHVDGCSKLGAEGVEGSSLTLGFAGELGEGEREDGENGVKVGEGGMFSF